jgi:diguanylate cyclase
VLRLHDAAYGWWVLLVATARVAARRLLARAQLVAAPGETRNLRADSALGGMWVAAMQFNLLPSVLLVVMLSIAKVSEGGGRLLAQTFALLVGGCAITSALLGFPVDVATPMPVVVACLPFLVIYPMAISAVAYELARKVTQQNRRLRSSAAPTSSPASPTVGSVSPWPRSSRAPFPHGPSRHADGHRHRPLQADQRPARHPVGDAVLCSVHVLRSAAARSTRRDATAATSSARAARDRRTARRRSRRHLPSAARARGRRRVRRALHREPGAAEADRQIANVEVWIQQADAALYRAKPRGATGLCSAGCSSTPLSSRLAGTTIASVVGGGHRRRSAVEQPVEPGEPGGRASCGRYSQPIQRRSEARPTAGRSTRS